MHKMTAIVFALVTSVAGAQGPDPRLTTTDVEGIAKKPVHTVAAGALAGAGPGLNFASADNKMLVMVNFGTDVLYRRAKEQKEMKMGSTTVPMVLFHADVPGIGDEAFDSPPGPVQYVIHLRKGTKGASLTTYFDTARAPRLPMEQLKALAKIVASRL